ncbi:MAG: hypothetical protein DSZ05_07405 [Sulfurospirillum sp.]|nr:MAG: hypothetical protein DSZ05_07405 [Sulfurospirillum sp.]
MKAPFHWDGYSDQPYPLKDKRYKKTMRRRYLKDYLPLLAINLLFYPLSLLAMPFMKSETVAKDIYGMGVDLDKGHVQFDLIEELGVEHILVRVPLWEMARIDAYRDFIRKWNAAGKTVLVNILQDREHIEDRMLLEKDIVLLFEKLSPFVSEFQAGNAINRTKWGFFSMEEYLGWYARIQQIRDRAFPRLKLVGSSVIDFEYHYTVRTLFNRYKVHYDAFSALLYVDRRGAPQNAQMGIFDTKRKIDLLYAMVRLSPKSENKIYITEVNWPLSGTAPWAPTSERECVGEEAYAVFMKEYFEIAEKTGKIARIYWHQLIAPGYGLVDNRDGKIRKTEAFYRFKEMIQHKER